MPVNIWLRPDGPSRETLARLRVVRINLAAVLFRPAMAESQRALEALKRDQPLPPAGPFRNSPRIPWLAR